jgi:hypothetical protein
VACPGLGVVATFMKEGAESLGVDIPRCVVYRTDDARRLK